jgi:hypothetical protein
MDVEADMEDIEKRPAMDMDKQANKERPQSRKIRWA